MIMLVLFGSFALFLFLTIPVGIALGLSVISTIIYSGDVSLGFFVQSLTTSVDSFPLLAIPFFILAGEIMGKGGITDRLFKFAKSMVGATTGGLAIATIITSMFFSAISGSGAATVAAVGGIMIPALVKEGYDKRFATALVCAAGAVGVIIPPSIPLIIFGVVGETSIGDLFIAGIFPGILVSLALMVWAYIYSVKKGYKSEEKTSVSKFLKAGWDAKWALLIPFIILGGIYGGIFTPTEAAVVAVIYGLITGLLLYKELHIKDLSKLITDAALTTATILIILGTASGFGKLLSIRRIPEEVASNLLAISTNPIIIMLLILLLLLIVGLFMETTAAIIILAPILLPVSFEIGIDPIHFGIIMVVGLAIGFITPPLGVNLFVGSGISGVSIVSLSKAVIPFFIAMVIALLIITFIPQVSLLFLN